MDQYTNLKPSGKPLHISSHLAPVKKVHDQANHKRFGCHQSFIFTNLADVRMSHDVTHLTLSLP